MLRVLMIPVLFAATFLVAAGARAQEPAPQRVSTQVLEELAQTIEDPAAREKLVDQLRALIEAQQPTATAPETAGLLDQLSAFFGSLTDELSGTAMQLIDQLAKLPDRVRSFWERLQQPEERNAILGDATLLAAILLVALMAGIALWRVLRRSRTWAAGRVERQSGTLGRVLNAVLVFALAVAPPVTMLAVTFAGLTLCNTSRSGAALLLALVSAIVVNRIARGVIELVFATGDPRLRLMPCDDATAARVSRSLARLLALGVYGFFSLEAIAAAGAEQALLAPLRSLYGLVLLITGIAFLLRYRGVRIIAEVEAAAEPPRWRRALQSILALWWIAAIAYMVGLYAVWMSQVEGGFSFIVEATALTALLVTAAAVAQGALRWIIKHLEGKARSWVARLPQFEERLPRYFEGLRVLLTTAVWILAAGFVLEAWGVHALETFAAPAVRAVVSTLLGILVVVLISLVVIDLATALTQNYLTRSEELGGASAKVKTLVPLANKTIKFVVTVMAGITILSQLGLQIGPILAGVGVLGLAVGFGAQALVKDIITGAFILIEDSVSVGDVVSLGGTGGLVEAINIRTIRLRDLAGNVHTIPFSTVDSVTNMTKEFSRYVIEAGVAYREDVDEVFEVLKALGAEMQEDPEFGSDIIEPIEILGLDRFEDSAVIVRARLTTKPIRQWAVGREFNRRMKKAFDERDIEIPFPHRTIYVGEDKEGTSPPLYVSQRTGAAPAQPT